MLYNQILCCQQINRVNMKTLAERLQVALNRRGISQAEAARKSGIAQQSINYIIKNRLTSSKLAPQIASAIGVNPEWLIYGRGPFEEAAVYKLPILHSAYMLIQLLNDDLNQNGLRYTVTDMDLGDNAFAYLLEPKRMALCTQVKGLTASQYLILQPTTVTVSDEEEGTAFRIVEWRTRDTDFFEAKHKT